MNRFAENIKIYGEVKDAIENNIPVVALESTMISHGMPYPENIETVGAVDKIIKSFGAIPATIAIINGKIKIGLSTDELEMLAKNKDVIKTSARDIPYVMARGLNGATTVAATMLISSFVKIKVFSTGGIGSVRKGRFTEMDISADLMQLTKNNLAVVCSGAKAVLDINPTLEVLETLGIPVIGYQTTNFPGFYIRKSGFRTAYSFDNIDDMANSIKLKWDMGLNGGVVIANPIPEEYELDENMINSAIEYAVKDAEAKKISGKELTPYLLSTLNDVTNGKSLKASMELIKNNASLAAKLSIELEKLCQTNAVFESKSIF